MLTFFSTMEGKIRSGGLERLHGPCCQSERTRKILFLNFLCRHGSLPPPLSTWLAYSERKLGQNTRCVYSLLSASSSPALGGDRRLQHVTALQQGTGEGKASLDRCSFLFFFFEKKGNTI